MNPAQRTRQQQTCHIRFKQLQSDGVLSVSLTPYQYAREVLGKKVESFKDLTDCELNALRDALEGKPRKLLDKLYQSAERAGIKDLARWMQAVAARSPSFAWLRGHRPETLPVSQQWRLAKLIERRRR